MGKRLQQRGKSNSRCVERAGDAQWEKRNALRNTWFSALPPRCAVGGFRPGYRQAVAQDSIFRTALHLSHRRRSPNSGIPIANGMHDYLAMLNERDGGIGGVKLVIEECETGYDTKKGVECYEALKGKKPVA